MTQEVKVLSGIGAAVLTIVILAVVFLSSSKSPSGPTISGNDPRLVRSDSYSTASLSGKLKVQVVEFGDYQCPACGMAYPTVKQVLKNYPGKVSLVFRNFPLTQHQNAVIAAEAAEAAGFQGKYWEMHNILYEKQTDWSDSAIPMNLFLGYAKDLGLDTTQFQKDITDKKFDGKIKRDMEDGRSLSINETPTFFINGEEFAGVPSSDQLKGLIDKDLSQ